MSTILSLDFWAFVGLLAGIYTIFTLGLQLQFGFTGLINFGQAAFMAIGAYVMAILVIKNEIATVPAALIGIIAAVVASLILGVTCVRLRSDFFAIATIAFAEIVRYVAMNAQGLTGGTQGSIAMSGGGTAATYGIGWQQFQGDVTRWLSFVWGDSPNKDVVMMVIVWVIAVVLMALIWWAVRSPWGRVLRAIREDEDAAASLGKNVLSFKLQSLAIGAALAAIAGLLYAYQFLFVSPEDFNTLTTFFGWLILLLGGTARIWAIPIGAFAFGIIFAATRFFDFAPFTWLDASERAYLRLLIVGVILLAIIAFRPQGILGRREEIVDA